MTTKYIVNNLSGQTINGESVLPSYKVYSALLSQSGDGTSTQTTGDLIIGARYIITTYVSDDDFTNVANVISGTINTDGCEFIAIGTTPDNYLNGSTLTDTGAPVATVLENTLGLNPIYNYVGVGGYYLEDLAGLFTPNKTFITAGINFAGRGLMTAYINSTTNIEFDSYSLGAASPTNGWLENTPIEIRVYN